VHSTVSDLSSPAVAASDLLARYRQGFHASCATYATTLLEMSTALLEQPGPSCCPAHLSLDTEVSHGGLYKALVRADIDTAEFQNLNLEIVAALGLPAVFTVDCTAVARPDSATCPERNMQHLGAQVNNQPGWCYQVVAAQTPGHNSWNFCVDVARVGPDQVKEELALEVMAAVAAKLGTHATFVFDSGYSSARLTHGIRRLGLDVTVVVRLASYQVMYEEGPAKMPGQRGGPKLYGPRFALKRSLPRRPPNGTATWEDSAYGEVTAEQYDKLRQKITRSTHPWVGPRFVDKAFVPIPMIFGTVVSVAVDRLPGKTTGGRLWMWSSTPINSSNQAQLSTLARAYFHRFDIEHMFRFFKQTLGLNHFKPQQPSTFDTWFTVVCSASNQLYLAREHVVDQRLPWERKLSTLSPGRTRRVIKSSLRKSWFPSRRGYIPNPGPGATKGTKQRQRTKHPPILKG
jgi:hypothetical protein